MAKRYILFYKPFGAQSQFSGAGHTLKKYISVPNVYPCGRLDHDSEGLLLLTDDGDFQHSVTDPKLHHPRTYWAQVEGLPSADALRQLESGVVIQGRRTLPAKARLLSSDSPNDASALPPRDPPIRFRKSVPTAWIELTLTEGRNRQVRRMTAAVGHPTLRLVRVAIGDLKLADLEPGQWRALTANEINTLKQ